MNSRPQTGCGPGDEPSSDNGVEPLIDPFGDVSVACRMLAGQDAGLRVAVEAIGAPHIRRRPGGFGGLCRIIVEQQVSVPSAQAILARCDAALDISDPRAVLAAGDAGLRACGLSGPKARYVTGLAHACVAGSFSFDRIDELDDQDASAALQAIKGVGPWSAAIYLLFCAGRSDIWPARDVALKASYSAASGVTTTQAELDDMAANWKPHRGIAAHVLWTYYAQLRGRAPI